MELLGTFETVSGIAVALADFSGIVTVLSDRESTPWGPSDWLRLKALLVWSLPFAPPDVFAAKRAILEEHCSVVGRDSKEITCPVQLALPADQAPQESVAQAVALGEVGVDVVIFSMRNPYRASTLESLAKALEG